MPEPHPDPDRAWVIAARNGDALAFEQLYRRHHRRIYALCLRLSGGKGQAEDHTQEVFVRAWQKLAQYRGEAQFASWLHRLAINLVLDQQRRQRWWHKLVPLSEQPEPQAAGPEDHGIDPLLPSLPTRPRQVFVLFAIEGYSHKEVGQLLGISEGASKAHYHRARQQLKEMLQ
ncbi:RNA polymerase sigma factor [Ferrimonas marina]